MALASTTQETFEAGMYRGRRAPENAVYDLVNGLINADRQIYRRGGNAYQSNANAGETLLGLTAAQLPIGDRTIAWGAGGIYVLDSDDATPISISGEAPRALARPAGLNGLVAFPSASGGYALLYGGARATNNYATGTVTVTDGSETVTGSGTSWTANVFPGMIFGSGTGFGVVLNVASNTSLTLTAPWSAGTAAGAAYATNVKLLAGNSTVADYSGTSEAYVAAVGTVPRLLIASKQRVYFSERGDPFAFDSTVYHELPAGVSITGATAIGDTAVIFTTAGVWAIQNMSFDPVDAYGNIQHTVAQLNEISLWGDPGIAGWGGALLVAAVDDVYLMPLDGPAQPITGGRGSAFDDGIRVLYRSYVAAGYAPGTAAVHRGHLLLPIVSGTTLIDVLVCNLASGFVWSRFAGHAASIAYAQRVGSTTRTPRLLAVKSQRITNNTGVFDPTSSNAVDADATTSDCVITTRDFDTGQQHGLVKRARLRYELTDDGSGGTAAPTVALAYTSDQDGGTFATLTDNGLQGGGTGGAVSTGEKYAWWLVAKKRERIRFRVTVTGACASFVLRSIELLMRPSGKQ